MKDNVCFDTLNYGTCQMRTNERRGKLSKEDFPRSFVSVIELFWVKNGFPWFLSFHLSYQLYQLELSTTLRFRSSKTKYTSMHSQQQVDPIAIDNISIQAPPQVNLDLLQIKSIHLNCSSSLFCAETISKQLIFWFLSSCLTTRRLVSLRYKAKPEKRCPGPRQSKGILHKE